MDWKTILWAALLLVALGFLLGLGLAVASKIFLVKEDPRIEEVEKMLPNANCGNCGYAGCHAMAEAIVTGKESKVSKCKPGKKEQFEKIIKYLDEHPNEDGSKVKVTL